MNYQLIIITICIVVKAYCLRDYYWKDYLGKIPDDAFPGGNDVENETTYVGQVFIQEEGIFPATIIRGNRVAFAPQDGGRKSENYIMILCSDHPEYFKWVRTNKTHFHFDTMYLHLVRGGVQTSNWLHIGRISYQGEIIVGKVLSGRAGLDDVYMSFLQNGEEKSGYSYDVLSFDKAAAKADDEKDKAKAKAKAKAKSSTIDQQSSTTVPSIEEEKDEPKVIEMRSKEPE